MSKSKGAPFEERTSGGGSLIAQWQRRTHSNASSTPSTVVDQAWVHRRASCLLPELASQWDSLFNQYVHVYVVKTICHIYFLRLLA